MLDRTLLNWIKIFFINILEPPLLRPICLLVSFPTLCILHTYIQYIINEKSLSCSLKMSLLVVAVEGKTPLHLRRSYDEDEKGPMITEGTENAK